MMKNTIIRIVAMLLCVNILSGCMSHPLTEEEMRTRVGRGVKVLLDRIKLLLTKKYQI